MKKTECIKKYGETEYVRRLQQTCDRHALHREEDNAKTIEWQKNHPDKVEANRREQARKGGKYYKHKLKYDSTGLRGKRRLVRGKHGNRYRPFKQIIAPESQIHHEWIPGTADYIGVALVEADPHRHGIIDTILILEGEITLLTEEEVRGGTG